MINNPEHRIAKLRKQIEATANRDVQNDLTIVLAKQCFYWRRMEDWYGTITYRLKMSPIYHSEERMLKAALKKVRKIRGKR